VHGLLGPHDESDPYVTTPRRAWWLRPLSWRRNGVLLTPTRSCFAADSSGARS
jgi:putative membrane protein